MKIFETYQRRCFQFHDTFPYCVIEFKNAKIETEMSNRNSKKQHKYGFAQFGKQYELLSFKTILQK